MIELDYQLLRHLLGYWNKLADEGRILVVYWGGLSTLTALGMIGLLIDYVKGHQRQLERFVLADLLVLKRTNSQLDTDARKLLTADGLPRTALDFPPSAPSTELIKLVLSAKERDEKRLATATDKSKAYLVAITLALGVSFTGMKSLIDLVASGHLSVVLSKVALVLIVLSAAYFLLAGLLAVSALEVRQWAEPGLDDMATRKNENLLEIEIQCLEINRLRIRMTTNLVATAQQMILRGVVCLAILIVTVGTFVFLS